MKKKGLLSDIQFVSISVDKEPDTWKNFIYQYDMADYMENILLGRDKEHLLSSFLCKEVIIEATQEKKYAYLTPEYCLVKDGIIMTNSPILPEDRDQFLNQFD